jgi:hypothetical protein
LDWIEAKYINLLSYRLRNFKRKQAGVINFSCPLCLDSSTDKFKARGYIYTKKGRSAYHCHNCGRTLSVGNLIKAINPSVYKDFVLERMQDTKPKNEYVERMKTPIFRKEGILKGLKTVSQLMPSDPVKQLVVARKIPNKMHPLLFKCDKFMCFTNTLIPGKFDSAALKHDSTRLLIPFFNKEKKCFAYQGRAIGSDNIRYITIVIDDDEPKVYGLDRMDPNKNVFVFEGPIDSMFVDNAIATAGGDMVATLDQLPVAKENLIICYDNEKHNEHTIKKINKAIDHGYKVVIYPDNFKYKDINEAIMAGMNTSDIHFILDRNIVAGLTDSMRLSSYSKV